MKMALGETIDDILNNEALMFLLGYLDKYEWDHAIRHMEGENAFGTLEAIKTYQKQVYEYWGITKD
tara:strand:- start:116 stop:313 length:198 start_codon:yes stop_codon:yes gene_type:complete